MKRTHTLVSILLLSSLFFLGACSHTSVQEYDPKKAAGPKQKAFNDSYERVWRAVQLSLAHYPVRVNDMDAGVLETDYVRGEKAWSSPQLKKRVKGGLRYKVSVRVLKGSMSENPAVQVTVLKQTEYQRDFFSSFERIQSDGLEEISLLYRIERELTIQKALDRVKL